MEDKQMQRVNEAAEKFAEAVRESYETMGNHSAEARDQSTKLTQSFFESVIQELDRQSQNNQQLSEQIMEQTRKQQEAFQSLSQESTKLYMDFLNSMFSYYQGGGRQGGRSNS
ncbi:MAG: hypothetical protein L0G70_08405 [Rubrobacter sp.]|nr:hypothetical protein [Rubrobacter sp.]